MRFLAKISASFAVAHAVSLGGRKQEEGAASTHSKHQPNLFKVALYALALASASASGGAAAAATAGTAVSGSQLLRGEIARNIGNIGAPPKTSGSKISSIASFQNKEFQAAGVGGAKSSPSNYIPNHEDITLDASAGGNDPLYSDGGGSPFPPQEQQEEQQVLSGNLNLPSNWIIDGASRYNFECPLSRYDFEDSIKKILNDLWYRGEEGFKTLWVFDTADGTYAAVSKQPFRSRDFTREVRRDGGPGDDVNTTPYTTHYIPHDDVNTAIIDGESVPLFGEAGLFNNPQLGYKIQNTNVFKCPSFWEALPPKEFAEGEHEWAVINLMTVGFDNVGRRMSFYTKTGDPTPCDPTDRVGDGCGGNFMHHSFIMRGPFWAFDANDMIMRDPERMNSDHYWYRTMTRFGSPGPVPRNTNRFVNGICWGDYRAFSSEETCGQAPEDSDSGFN